MMSVVDGLDSSNSTLVSSRSVEMTEARVDSVRDGQTDRHGRGEEKPCRKAVDSLRVCL